MRAVRRSTTSRVRGTSSNLRISSHVRPKGLVFTTYGNCNSSHLAERSKSSKEECGANMSILRFFVFLGCLFQFQVDLVTLAPT